jgi:hypothetical protein
VRFDRPDLGGLPNQEFDQCRSVFGYFEELLPKDFPNPLGKSVTIIA